MDKFFKISERGSTIKTEIMAGLTTFFAMAYIVLVNPNQVAGEGSNGWLAGAVPDMAGELGTVWNAVFIASILVAIVGTLLMAFLADMPFAQACGMGLNSFFCTIFVAGAAFAGVSVIRGYQAGLVIVLISGLVFLILSVTGLRKYIAVAMPECLKKSIPAGIGLFIALIGLKNATLIQDNPYTFVQFFDFHGVITSAGSTKEAIAQIAPPIVAFVGFIIIAILAKLNVKGNIIIGILASTVLYYVMMLQAPNFDFSSIGQSFKDFGSVGFLGVFQGQAWKDAFSAEYIGGVFSAIMLVVSFCLVDMFDTIGTLVGTASRAGMVDKEGNMPNMKEALVSDSVATVVGAVTGTSTVTTFVESASGVEAGGRTGLTAFTTGILFLACIFIAPLAAIIPAAATSSALIYVGILMLGGLKKVDFEDLSQVAPVALMLIAMPISGSIGHGIGLALISYTIMKVFTGKAKDVSVLTYIISAIFLLKFFLVV